MISVNDRIKNAASFARTGRNRMKIGRHCRSMRTTKTLRELNRRLCPSFVNNQGLESKIILTAAIETNSKEYNWCCDRYWCIKSNNLYTLCCRCCLLNIFFFFFLLSISSLLLFQVANDVNPESIVLSGSVSSQRPIWIRRPSKHTIVYLSSLFLVTYFIHIVSHNLIVE